MMEALLEAEVEERISTHASTAPAVPTNSPDAAILANLPSVCTVSHKWFNAVQSLIQRLMDSNFPCPTSLDEHESFVMASEWLWVLRDHGNHCNVGTCKIDRFNRSLNLS